MDIEQRVNTREELMGILRKVSFAPSCVDFRYDWEVKEVYEAEGHVDFNHVGWHVRTSFSRPDTQDGVVRRGFGRWEFVEIGTGESGVAKTCWLLLELIVRHELMEGFLFDGDKIFNPHHRVGELASVCRLHALMNEKYNVDTKPARSSVTQQGARMLLEDFKKKYPKLHAWFEKAKLAEERAPERSFDELRKEADERGQDVYQLIASRASDIPYENVTKGMRDDVKTALFGYPWSVLDNASLRGVRRGELFFMGSSTLIPGRRFTQNEVGRAARAQAEDLRSGAARRGEESEPHQVSEPSRRYDSEVERVWETFWLPLLNEAAKEKHTSINAEIKNELFDYHAVLEEVPKVYMAVTDHHISKPNTSAEAVIGEFEARFERRVEPRAGCQACHLEAEIGTEDVPHPIDKRLHTCTPEPYSTPADDS